MAFTDAEKARIRYHLGYPGVQFAASLQFGIPKPIQTAFLVEQAMNNVISAHEQDIRGHILPTLEHIECLLAESATHLVATGLGDLKLNPDEPQLLEREYVRWANRLADTLGVPLYAYSKRFSGGFSAAGNVPITG